MPIDLSTIRKDFPFTDIVHDGKKITYLDNAATSQKPYNVINAITDYYKYSNANVHRGIHYLSEKATELYENSRKTVATFINANIPEEVIFTSGATHSLNFAAQTLANAFVTTGDKILIFEAEHHSNFVPWQQIAMQKNAKLEVVPITENGDINLQLFETYMDETVKIVAVSHASNVLGTIFSVREIAKITKKYGALLVVDGAQAIPHIPVNVQQLGCDAYAFSGHKMLGPTGVGVLWLSRELLHKIQPYQFGGGMIDAVYIHESTWTSSPARFEAGTPHISGAIGLGAAISYLDSLGMATIREHELSLLAYAFDKLTSHADINIIGPLDINSRTGLISFSMNGVHPHDLASILNTEGIAIRAGHHCAMPLHHKLRLPATARASFYLYNGTEDIDLLVRGIAKARKILK